MNGCVQVGVIDKSHKCSRYILCILYTADIFEL